MTATAIAIYSAFLSTGQFLWLVYSHVRERHWIRCSVLADIERNDGVEVEVLNRGGKPSTVLQIQVVAFDNFILEVLGLHYCVWHFRPEPTAEQPSILPPGGCYREFYSMRDRGFERFVDAVKNQRLWYRIRMSHCDRWYTSRVLLTAR